MSEKRSNRRYKPKLLEEIGGWYASDPRWAAKVAGCMKIIVEAAVQDGEALITVDSVRKMHDRFLRGEVKAG